MTSACGDGVPDDESVLVLAVAPDPTEPGKLGVAPVGAGLAEIGMTCSKMLAVSAWGTGVATTTVAGPPETPGIVVRGLGLLIVFVPYPVQAVYFVV